MDTKIYSAKELNALMGYDLSNLNTRNSSKAEILRRCKNAGIIVEALPTKRGLPNQYVIIENNLNLPGEEWVDCYFYADWEVSSEGRIRRKSTKKLMGHVEEENNYIRVCTTDPKTGKSTN